MSNLAWLARGDEMFSFLYVAEHFVDDDGKLRCTVHLSSSEDIPWPVALTLATHSKKHVFEHGAVLPLRRVGDAVALFDRRLKWAWHYRNSVNDYVKPLVKNVIPPCKHIPDAMISNFSSAVRSAVFDHIKAGNKLKVMVPAFLKFTLKWLSLNQYTCQVSDKDGVFVLVKHLSYQIFQAAELAKSCYRPVSPLAVETEHGLALKASRNLAARLKGLGFEKWSSEVYHWTSLCNAPSTLLCRWNCTVKSHKPYGAVVARSLHSSVNHLHNSLSEVLNRILNPILQNYRHVCVNTDAVQDILLCSPVPHSAVLLKFDVKEFFLSGEHLDIATAVASLVEGRQLSSWVMDAIMFVLSTQFVAYDPSTHFQVTRGSGMGMRHSGILADLTSCCV